MINKLIILANHLDQIGFYTEADAIDDILGEMLSDDDILDIINDLDANIKNQPAKKEKPKQEDESIARSNGHVGTGVYDNGTSGMGSGISDGFFYSSYTNLENK